MKTTGLIWAMGWIANEWAKKTKAMSNIKGVSVVKNKDFVVNVVNHEAS